MTLDLEDYVTIPEAAADSRIPYTPYWIRRLAQEDKIQAVKVGSLSRGQWLVHFPSLLQYVAEMERLGTQKHSPD